MAECEICGKVLKNTQGLNGHRRFVHGSQHSGALASAGPVLDEHSPVLNERSAALDGRSAALDEQPAVLDEYSVELDHRSAALDEQSAVLEQRTIADFPYLEQAAFLRDAVRTLDDEAAAILFEQAGKGKLLNPYPMDAETQAKLAETVDNLKAEEVLVGRIDKPGYKFLDCLGVSIRVKA